MASDPALKPTDDPEFFEREAEQDWAKKHHFPTKLLGWSIIASVLLSVVGAIIGDSLDFGGILYLIGGAYILGGSQAWLRFVTFCYTGATAGFLFALAWPPLVGQPFTIEHPDRWVTWSDRDFWLWLVLPGGIFAGLATLSIVCLRTRRLRFWTKPARIWGGIAIGLVAIQLAVGGYFTLRDQRMRRRVEEQFPTELTFLRTHRPGLVSGHAVYWLTDPASTNPRIRSVALRSSPNSKRNFHQSDSAVPPGNLHTHTEFLRLPSGEWAQLELEVILPP